MPTLILALSTANRGIAQGYPSPSEDLFVPGQRVPLSEFAKKTTSTIVLHVDPEVLTWIAGNSGVVQVAVRNLTGQLTYFNATSVNPTSGEVTLTSGLNGSCVAVSTSLRQDLAVVTHWNQTLNGGRGGQQIGAKDGLTEVDLDTATGTLVPTGGYLNVNTDPTQPGYWGDPDPAVGPFYFASDLYAVFSDGTGANDTAATPGFERYIGETYSVNAPTNLAAIWLSDQVRTETGFPIAHRNHPLAFDLNSPAGKRVEDGLPLFQVVHCHLVDIGNLYPATAGSENSLGTFLLPPGWSSQSPAATYPILFNGFYDIHGSTFGVVGMEFFKTLGALYRHVSGPRRAVGVLWNGGGADACYTMQRSAYDGAARLIADAATLLKADPERVVFSGGSRGGGTALEMASNPYGAPYTAQFVNAAAPQVRPGEVITFANPSYSLVLGSFPRIVGYGNAWKSTWREPITMNTGEELTMLNMFGTDDPVAIDTLHANDSALYRSSLLAEGARVLLHVGTHDFSLPFAQVATYANNLRSDGVPLHLQVFYRFGHTSPADTVAENTGFLNQIFDDVDSIDEVTEHFARDAANYTLAVPIDPDHIPLVYELPIIVSQGQPQTWSLVGQPLGRFEVRAARMDPAWQLCQAPVYVNPLATVLSGVFPATGGEFSTASFELALPVASGFWWFEVAYSPDGDTTFETTLGQGDIAPPITIPCEEPVVAVIPATIATEVIGIDDQTRTGGLAEDGRFPPSSP